MGISSRMSGKSRIAGAAFALAMALALPATAQDGRYTMKDVDGGLLRLDTQTGEVSYCSRKEDGWTCETARDDRSDLADEIVRLQEENADLRNRIARLEQRDQTQDRQELKLPSDQDMDKVLGFMERLMRRFYAFAKSLREQLEDGTYAEET